MQNAKYIVRFDDICPTMNWVVWERIEELLLQNSVTPILAVVPDNRHPALEVGAARHDFWDRVREWQSHMWTVGLHGHQHQCVTNAGGIISSARFSEFAGVPIEHQRASVRAAVAVFARERVKPEVWVAPWHSFDAATLAALAEVGIRTISDGLSTRPYTDGHGFLWIPQQLWKFSWQLFGVWTVCYHHNHWRDSDLIRFEADLTRYREAIISVAEVRQSYSGRNPGLPELLFPPLHRLRGGAYAVKNRLRNATGRWSPGRAALTKNK